MNIIDIVLAIILLIGLFRGLKNGLIREVFSLVGIILGIYLAINYATIAEGYLKRFVSWDDSVIKLISFALTFILVLSVIGIISRLLTKLASALFLGWVNKFFGAAFGLLKYALILSVVVLIFDGFNKKMPFVEKDKFSDSVSYNYVKNLVPTVFPNFIVIIKEEINKK